MYVIEAIVIMCRSLLLTHEMTVSEPEMIIINDILQWWKETELLKTTRVSLESIEIIDHMDLRLRIFCLVLIYSLTLLTFKIFPKNMAIDGYSNQDNIIYSWQLLTRTESESKESVYLNETLLKVLKYCDISLSPRAAKSAQNKRGVWWMINSWKRKT